LGGTKLAAALVDEAGRVLAERHTPVIRDDWPATIRQIEEEAAACLAAAGAAWSEIRSTGIIVPGIAGPDGSVWAPNLWGDRDVPLGSALGERLPVPAVVDNDRSGYVLGEQWLGAARDCQDAIFVAVGTGIGVGVLMAGRVLRGCAGIAGAAGWMALTTDRQPEYSQHGCWEWEAAGPALARKSGFPSAEEAVAAVRRGDPSAVKAVHDVARWLGLGVANLISVLNPAIVILGGGLMSAGDLFLDPIRQTVLQVAQPRAARMARIVLSQLGPRAGLLGAARLAWHRDMVL
jgi:glucokinase